VLVLALPPPPILMRTTRRRGLTSPILLALITDDDIFATADLAALLDPPGANATQHYGPYPRSSPDSGPVETTGRPTRSTGISP